MKKPLSGSHFMLIGGVAGLFVAIFALCIINFSGKFGPNTRSSLNPIWITLALISAGLTGLGIWLLLRRPTNNPDYPDILGQIFPHAHLMELEALHLTAFAFQHGPSCRVVVAAQNLYDQPSDLRLEFSEHITAPLRIRLPAGAVMLAWIDASLGPNGGHFKTVFRGAATIAGNRIRPRTRNLLGRNSMQNAALLLKRPGFLLQRSTSGPIGNAPMRIIFADLAGKLPIQLAPAASVPVCQVPKLSGAWQATILWDPSNKPPPDAIAGQLAKLLGNAPVEYHFPFRMGITADTAYALHPG